MGAYKDLIVWQKSMQLVKSVYGITDQLPESEKRGLTSQIRRAVTSIPANIAEGYGRNYPKERKQFLAQATGSAREVETQLMMIKELGFVGRDDMKKPDDLVIEVLKMLSGLSKAIGSKL